MKIKYLDLCWNLLAEKGFSLQIDFCRKINVVYKIFSVTSNERVQYHFKVSIQIAHLSQVRLHSDILV